MIGLETYAATKKSFVGIDWANFASGALKTAGGAFGGGGADPAAATAKLEAEKKLAEQQASNWKMIGIIAGLIVLVGGFALMRQPKAA